MCFNYQLKVSESLKERKNDFGKLIADAVENIGKFAEKYGWEEHAQEPFFREVFICDTKQGFDNKLLQIAGIEDTIELPKTYCAALEDEILILVSPEIYARVYPQGVEEGSYEKLITHEIAHRFHIRILGGNEEAMGPIWFYEGFAIFVADQFSHKKIDLHKNEMMEIIKSSQRGSYLKYGALFRYLENLVGLKSLMIQSQTSVFQQYILSLIEERV